MKYSAALLAVATLAVGEKVLGGNLKQRGDYDEYETKQDHYEVTTETYTTYTTLTTCPVTSTYTEEGT